MRRYILPSLLLLVFVSVAYTQRTTASAVRDSRAAYLPLLVSQPTLTPMPVPTATPRPTATPVPDEGTGVYKLDGDVSYHAGWDGTMLYGFIRLYDGAPNTFGGPNGYRVVVCFGGWCGESYPVDSTGYYSAPLGGPPAAPIKTRGYAYVVAGSDDERVSENYVFDTNIGTCWRMDFIECSSDDDSDRCELSEFEVEATVALEDLALAPARRAAQTACPPQ